MTAAEELRAAAAKLRDLATRTDITLERHELQWTDLTVTGAPGTVSPMVWSQHAAAMSPVVSLALADWLESTAASLDASTHPDWQETVAAPALAVARALTTARAL